MPNSELRWLATFVLHSCTGQLPGINNIDWGDSGHWLLGCKVPLEACNSCGYRNREPH